jgi:RNA polymerase sigma-70 factor (ECF subfamily)
MPQHDDFARFLEPMHKRMLRLAWRIIRDAEETEDALQDAATKIWQRWDAIHHHPNAPALVLRICADAAHDVLRRRIRRRRKLEALNPRQAAAGPSPPQIASNRERLELLQQAIARLPRKQSTALLLHVLEDQSYGQVADALGCAEATARKHAARARDRLRQTLERLASPTN